MFFGSAWIVSRWRLVGIGAESFIQGQLKWHLFPARILAEAVSMTHSGMQYWLHCCFRYSSFRNLQKFYKDLPLSPITFTVNIHTDNHSNKLYHFYYLFQILCSMILSVFLLKGFQGSLFWNLIFYEALLLFFQIKITVYRKKL